MRLSNRIALVATLATMLASSVAGAFAAETEMVLFKVISDRDEVIIGLSADTLAESGTIDAGTVGRLLADNGELAAWQYTVSKNAQGDLVEIPSQWISVLAQTSIRIEPYASALPVISPAE